MSSHRAGKRPRMAGQPSPPKNVARAGPSLIIASSSASNRQHNASSSQQQQQAAATATLTTTATTATTTKGQEDHAQAHQAAKSAQATNNNNDYSMLLRLSMACKKHQAWHKENPVSSHQDDNDNHDNDNNNHALFKFPCLHVQNTPEKCQRELGTLGRALVQLENEYQASGHRSINNKNGGPTPEHVGHMCDFYRDALAGGFCPHAPHLFQLGRGAIDIMPRIHFLLQHVVSKSIISNTIATIHHVNAENAAAAAAAAVDEGKSTITTTTTTENNHSISVGGVADTIADTVARLLHAIPEFQLQACILRDLVNLAFDLTLLLMPDDDDDASQQKQRQQQQQQQQQPWVVVEVVLMPETVQQSGSFEHNDTTTQEFVIPISSADAATALLTAIYKVALQWMELKKMQRLRPPQDTYADMAIARAWLNYNDSSSSSSSAPLSSLNLSIASDLYFYSIMEHCDENIDILSNLRAALGQILVSSSSSSTAAELNTVMMTHRGRLLHWKCQAAAAQLGSALFHDYARSRSCTGTAHLSSASEIVELAIMSVRAARLYIQQSTTLHDSSAATAGTSRQNSSKTPYSSSPRGSPCRKRPSLLSSSPFSSCSCRMALGQALATLVSDALLIRHCVPGSTTMAEVQSMVQRATIPTLLECLSCVLAEKSSVTLFCSSSNTTTTTISNNRSDRELSRVLFSALHQAVQDDEGADFVSMAILTHPTNHGQILGKLFSLLGAGSGSIPCTDCFFMETTVEIIAAILCPVHSNNTNYCRQSSMLILVDIQNVCRWCMAENEREGNASVVTADDESPSAGSKRKSNESSPTGNQNKRRKSCEDSKHGSERPELDCSVEDASLRSADEELGRLLLQAYRAVRSLREARSHIHSASNAETTDNEMDGKLRRSIANVLCVSNTLQLLSLLLVSQQAPPDAEQNDSVTAPVKMMVSGLLELFDSFRINGELSIPKEGRPPHMLWGTMAQCAKAASKLFGHSVLGGLVRPLVLFVENDLWVAELLQGRNGLPLDTLLRCVDLSEERQEWRLRVLNRCQGKTASPHNSLSLQQRTFDIVDNFDAGHSDPRIRLLRWQSTVWLFLSASKPQELRRILTNSSHTSSSDSIAAESMISGLLTTAFADKDPRVRDYASRELGRFLVTNDHMAILATLSRNDEWRHMWQVDNDQAKIASVSEVISRFYKAVDKLLYQYCKVPESELSFTVAPSDPSNQGQDAAQSRDSIVSFQRAAVRFILSMCEGLDTTMHIGRLVLQNSLMRVVRLWSGHHVQVETVGLSFGEVARTFRRVGAQNLLHNIFMECFTPGFFQDTLAPHGVFNESSERQIANLPPPWIVERQYRMLLAFIQQFLLEPSGRADANTVGPTGDSALTQVGSFLEKWLPFVIAQMVVEKDYGSLRLTAGFKLFFLSKKRYHDSARMRSSSAIYSDLLSDRVHTEKKPSKSPSWTRDLELKTCQMCLAPSLSDRLHALLLKGAEKSELAFYTRDVLQNKISLKTIISKRPQLIIKELVRNLGCSRTGTGPALKAIKAAATALLQSDPSSQSAVDAKEKNLSHESATTAASDWISTHFMYLLVNVVQSRWALKDEAERVHAMRCLKFILPLLNPKEAAQYFPQMMTTVNAAISHQPGANTDSKRLCLVSEVRHLAVECLDKFVRLVGQQQMEALGENLTSVVVSLIPVIAEEDERGFNDRHIEKMKSRTTDEAVALLEWLSGGDRGRKLARCWKGIPFLPQTPALDVVRANLKKVKVDYDNLLATDTQMTSKRSTLSSSSKQSEGGSASGDSKSASSSPKKLLDLRKRLDMICTFLGNENASIRRVFLDHLLSLLRSHRELFLALIDNEGSSSMKRFLTEVYPGAIQSSRGVVTEMVTTLLGRCVRETDPTARVLLATCFGEVGAIAEQKLEVSAPTAERGGGEVPDNAYDAYDWRLQRPPWHTLPSQYQFQLVTKDLVTTMKAAPDSTDQNKVAFAVQQLLVLLDKSATKEEGLPNHPAEEPPEDGRNKPPMSPKLSKALADAGVLDIVEPFWFTEFSEKEPPTAKQPPFFQTSRSYYAFLSNWIGYMVHRASESRKSEWTMCFHACRTAFRTQAALSVAEFLLPILVLDRLCFGNGHDEEVLIREIRDALTFGEDDGRPVETRMSHSERQQVVSVIFSLLDTFQAWSERDAEERNQGHSRSGNGRQSTDSNSDWQREESVMRIEDVLQTVPLSLQAHAAASVGMHARALRLLETASRATVADEVFNAGSSGQAKVTRSRASGSCPAGSLDLMKKTLAALNDHDTMVSLGGESIVGDPLTRALDAIRRTEASGDWNGALQAYERAQQLAGPEKRDTDLNRGALQCLLELGHFESVLSQVKGVLNAEERKGEAGKTIPYAIEAAWRLGRWDTLSEMSRQAATTDLDPDGRHMFHVGQTMLALHDGNLQKALTELKEARIAVMDRLSSAAQESYTRAYDHVVKLHCLREIEDAAHIICVAGESPTLGSFARYGDGNWERRLDLAAPDSAVKIINTRLALARLSRDLSLEGSLFLGMGKRARKKGDFHIASNAFSQAEGALDSAASGCSFHLEKCSLQMEIARLRHESGEFTSALQLVALEDVEGMADLDETRLRAAALERVRTALRITEHGMDEDQMIEVFVQRALQSTEWMIQGGLAGGSETMARFRTIQRVNPKWEKGHFQYARYIESAMQSRMTVLQRRFSRQRVGVDENLLRSHTFVEDRACQKYLMLAVKHYVEALSLELTHLYQALPRLLFLWFDFTSTSTLSGSLPRTASEFTQYRSQPSVNDALKELAERQKELNVFLAKEITRIPALAFYTALPQLISRISTNDQSESYLVVRSILKRVLAKFPAQAMWPLAWVRQSKDAARREVGNEIFQAAERSQLKLRNTAMHSLLVASQSLFRYLLDLAQLNVKSLNKKEVRIKPWVGETELAEFIPPVQAALTPSSIPAKYSRTTDVFLSRNVPRMKAFSRNVALMSSKARPKKLKAIAVSADPNARNPTGGKDDCHLGEIHFLVKQEAKGDLRKDARVQDLNNVINRLLASSGDGKGSSSRQRRRLHLRTFAVTCLSEDTGILEWVPNTLSLRTLVSDAYNPQAAPLSSKRRGLRMTNPGDPILRNNYEKKCQEMYFVSHNLKRAAALFEELLLKPNPPLLHWWFVQQYRNPHDWYEARTRFAESTAVWSAVGHVIGLGDRHAENILVDVSRGECVHVDFDCIFDKGLNLPKAEVIPFRLTSNMIDAFGPTGADGVYSGSLKDAMKTLRDNRDTLLSVLEPFLKDPIIDWKRTRSQQQKMRAAGGTGIVPASTQDRQTKEAKRSIHVIDERLRGIYNLRNPNHKKIRRADGMSATAVSDDQEHDEMTQLMPLSVPGQVHKMIAEATSSENLVQLFVGWMPWV